MERPKSELNLEHKERINDFLKNHVFQVEMDIAGDMKLIVPVKLQITGTKKYIRIGNWEDHVEYTVIIEKPKPKNEFLVKAMFPHHKTYEITTTNNPFFRLTMITDNLLEEFLEYWGIKPSCIPTKAINKVWESINESIISESKNDSVTRKVVKDIIQIFKDNSEGDFVLPEDISENLTYSFPQLKTEFTVDVEIKKDTKVKTFDVDAEFSKDDDTIFIKIIKNPESTNEIIFDLIGELNELISHELTHIVQYEKNYEFPKKEPKKPFKYYTQYHELEAQIKGLKRKAKITGKKFEEVVKDWFEKNQHKHKLSKKEIEKVMDKILTF